MKRIVLKNPYQVEVEDTPLPNPGPEMLLVKAEISGVSAGTEMMIYRGSHPNYAENKGTHWAEYPIYPGYELVGTVVSVGSPGNINLDGKVQSGALGPTSPAIMTRSSDFKVGDRVICLGEHSEYACVPANMAAKIPDNVSSMDATLAVLATTSMHGIRKAQIQYGDTVAVIGMGVLGYLCMQHAKNAGSRRVIAIDLDNSRLEVAKLAGADACINPRDGNLIEQIMEVNDGLLADVVIEASGFAGTEQMACEIVRTRGKVGIIGWHTSRLDIHFSEVFNKELTIFASNSIGPEAGLPYSYVRWGSDQSLKWAVELISQGKLKRTFEPTIYPYSEIKEVYEKIDKHDKSIGMQVVLDWSIKK